MGYTTDFYGRFELNKKMDQKLADYINTFSGTRRMKRDVEKIKEIFPNWKNNGYNGELGIDGEFFIGGTGYAGQDNDDSIINYNAAPTTQPGLWCQWTVTPDLEGIEWDGGEKFYDYEYWLQYIIDNFLTPNGYKLTGEVEFIGEDFNDRGVIDIVNDDYVRVRYYKTYLEEDGYLARDTIIPQW